ncbi:MAG: hypothetical protein WCG19_06950 [Chlorobiaceae bacterium]
MGSLLLEAPFACASDFIDRRYAIVIAAFLSLLCAVYLPMAMYVNYQAFILLFLWGVVNGAIYAISLALIGEKYEGNELVAANAGGTEGYSYDRLLYGRFSMHPCYVRRSGYHGWE